MGKCMDWSLPAEEEKVENEELTASLFGELGLLLTFVGMSVYYLIKGKDVRPLLILMLGFLTGRKIGEYIETESKLDLLSAALIFGSGSLYAVSCILDDRAEQ